MALHSHIQKVLWTQDQISCRVSELASEISDDFRSIQPPPVVVGVATGAFVFLADLVRKIELPVPVDFVRVESYGSGTESNGAPTISFDLKVDIQGRHVILCPDYFVVGYGMDFAEVYRNLPYVGVLKPEHYK
ncbi:Hypoxanthine phosphoribosyltransferase [Quillaja saponaria]|uniref:Hypoxanthine phosphoribosyltransferase n=1 Tax=Quillaja saponaria TaxID=32244 RepID=A0AAD7Q364_QUISA|nr:Hypoxanthine phosphoribosyltransferase [Quillaja saponaria]